MSKRNITLAVIVLAAIIVAFVVSRGGKKPQAAAAESTKPALTVTTTSPEKRQWSERVLASGSVLAWQEAIVGAEIGGVRLAELEANVGDRVKKGDVLARFAEETVVADLHQQEGAFEEARARYHEAQLNAQRAQQIKDAGVLSAQELQQFSTTAEVAEAQMKSAEAKLDSAKLKLRYTKVVAPDDGLISTRTATVGSVVQAGSEMFRLIRQGRLEWRAELSDVQMQQIRVGQKVQVRVGATGYVNGAVLRISPSIDMQTRNGYVYIGLPENKELKAGMFTQGEFELGRSDALTLPQSAVVIRDGFSYVYQVSKEARVTQVKVVIGRRQGDRIEVSSGLSADATVVTEGASFLNDGDLVRIETAKTNGKPKMSAAKSSAYKTNL